MLNRVSVQTEQARAELESDPLLWLVSLFPADFDRGFASHQKEFWDWIWSIRPGQPAAPFVAIWARGHAKSTSAEAACVALAARSVRRYGIYVHATQSKANEHVANVASKLLREQFRLFYPAHAQRKVDEYSHSLGWTQRRLRTAGGFTLDALGLDASARGSKIDEQRPDLLILDDLDSETDTPAATERKLRELSRKILPALTPDAVVVAIQNLVLPDGIFSRLAGRRTDILAHANINGPVPAVAELEYESRAGVGIITAGQPTWAGFDLDACQSVMDLIGVSAFLAECQHQVDEPAGGMFDHLEFRRCRLDEVPPLDLVTCWVDPAVTATDSSDAHGIQVDGLARDRTIYRLFSYEQRATPLDALSKALVKAKEYGAAAVAVETIHGRDTWQATFREAQQSTGIGLPMREQKSVESWGGKVQRAQQMLVGYETGRFVHVEGTHQVLERALRRFPKVKPFDLVDAAGWSALGLLGLGHVGEIVAVARGRLPRLTPSG